MPTFADRCRPPRVACFSLRCRAKAKVPKDALVSRIRVFEQLLKASKEGTDSSKSKFTRLNEGLLSFAQGVAAGLAVPIALLGAPAIAAAESNRRATNKIRLETGASGKDLESLLGVYQEVRRSARGGMDETATAVADLNTRLGLTGADLSTAAGSVIRMARVAGSGVGNVTETVSRAMSAWSVSGKDLGSAMDGVEIAARVADGGVAGLSEQLAKHAPTLKAAGLTIEQATSMVADLSRFGVPADEALTAIGAAAGKLAQTGRGNISKALVEHLESIRRAPSPASAASTAVALFGEQGVKMADAIRRGALSLDAVKGVSGKAPATEPVTQLVKAFQDLRIKVEFALIPLGQAIYNTAWPAVRMGVSLAGRVVDALGAAAAAFGRMPQWVQTTLVVLAGIVALVGPVLVFASTVIAPVAGLVLTGAKTVGLMNIAGFAFGSVAVQAVAAAAGTSNLAESIKAAAPTGVAPAILLAGAAITVSSLAASTATAAIETRALESIQDGRFAAAEKVTHAQVTDMPRFTPPQLPRLNVAPIPIQTITGQAIPTFDQPQVSPMPWQAAYDWLKSFADRMSAGPPIGQQIRAPAVFQDLKSITQAGIDGTDNATIIERLLEIGRLKGVRYQTAFSDDMDPEDVRKLLTSQLARALSSLSVGDSMRLHSWKIADFYSDLRQSGLLGSASIMPGSWLDANSPDAWMARAVETDRLVNTKRERDQFFVDQRQASDSYWINKYQQENAAKIAAFAKPQVYIAEDVFNAVQQGWQAAVGQWQSGAIGGGQAGASAPPPPPAPRPKPKKVIPSGPVEVSHSFGSIGGPAPRPAPGPVAPPPNPAKSSGIPLDKAKDQIKRLIGLGVPLEDAVWEVLPTQADSFRARGLSPIDLLRVLFPEEFEKGKSLSKVGA